MLQNICFFTKIVVPLQAQFKRPIMSSSKIVKHTDSIDFEYASSKPFEENIFMNTSIITNEEKSFIESLKQIVRTARNMAYTAIDLRRYKPVG